jgi:phosphatidylserine/phosphatidylglycerophosphate/cardiolipin synthase-like enzyme
MWSSSSVSPSPCDEVKHRVDRAVYDRGNPSQLINPHQNVDVKTYTDDKVKLPSPEEIPGINLEVQNYHVPPVGTFHAKYMVVDRKIAILNSNNIQDRVSSIGGPRVGPACS